MRIRLYYVVEDGGDGSAHPQFFTSRAAMDKYIEEQENSEYEFIDLSEGGSSVVIEVENYEVVL